MQKSYNVINLRVGVKTMDAKELVLDTLKNSEKPLRPGEIAEAAGLEKGEVDKAIKALKKEEKIMSPKRCYYSVSE